MYNIGEKLICKRNIKSELSDSNIFIVGEKYEVVAYDQFNVLLECEFHHMKINTSNALKILTDRKLFPIKSVDSMFKKDLKRKEKLQKINETILQEDI